MADRPIRSGVTRTRENRFGARIAALLRRVMPPISPDTEVQEWLDALREASASFDFHRAARNLAREMVIDVDAGVSRTWREAAGRSQQSVKLYQILQAEMAGPVGRAVAEQTLEAAFYIRSIPHDLAKWVTARMLEAQQEGIRPETLAKAMRARMPRLTANHVMLIARTETARTSATLTEVRAAASGVKWYVWRTSEDSRVRQSHRLMEGVVVPYADAPSPEKLSHIKSTLGDYQAGACPNCRCYQEVLLSPEDVSWPRRVYFAGQIRTMSASAFVKASRWYGEIRVAGRRHG